MSWPTRPSPSVFSNKQEPALNLREPVLDAPAHERYRIMLRSNLPPWRRGNYLFYCENCGRAPVAGCERGHHKILPLRVLV